MPKLKEGVQAFIVQRLAQYCEPVEIVDAVKEAFDVAVTRQQIHYYDPDRPGAPAKWRALFDAERQKFLDKLDGIPVANRAVRLRLINDVAVQARLRGNQGMVLNACEQAAKEAGGAYTNRQRIEQSGPGGAPIRTQARVILDMSGLTEDELDQLERLAAKAAGEKPKAG